MSALLAEEFFAEASLLTYQKLQKAVETTSYWSEICANVLWYLETRELPWNKVEAKPQCPAWPLPETGLPKLVSRGQQTFPMVETLIDIAITEKTSEQIIFWLDRRQPQKFWNRYDQPKNDQIANAIMDDYPERAIAIWKNIAEGFISVTGTPAYEEAAKYLRKIRHTLNRLNRMEEWQNYLMKLKVIHKMKRRLMEILERFSDQPLVKNQPINKDNLNLNFDNELKESQGK